MTPTTTEFKGLVTCRAGLEKTVAREMKALGLRIENVGRRAVFFVTDLAGIYRCNMGLRSGLSVLLPIRTFNARNYDLLYFQSRKTNWHKLFSVDKSLRIDVNGGSDVLRNSEYVVHRVKDGIVDTFRKLSGGVRPSVDKSEPDIHIVVHLDHTRVTLCIDTSGLPLFKRGYRLQHGIAPIKEDLAAGILQLSGWDQKTPLTDPMCGSGTFLFEAWMLATSRAPNLERSFAFQHLFDYDPMLHAAEKAALEAAACSAPNGFRLTGFESDKLTAEVTRQICESHFPDAPIDINICDFRQQTPPEANTFVVSNPPYGKRIGNEAEALQLHADLGKWIARTPSAGAAIYTANIEAAQKLGLPLKETYTLFNGALEGRLLVRDVAG